MGTIYLIRNTRNGKCYVGQTILKPERRINRHFNGNSENCTLIHRAIQKHGRDAFEVEILHENVFDFMLDSLEREEIKKHNSIAPNGYNLDSGGNTQKKRSPETIRKLAEASRGKKASPETRAKMSASRKGNKYLLGHTHSAKTREKMSKAKQGKPRSPETCQKISKSNARPEREDARSLFFSIPNELTIREKNKIMYENFPHIPRTTMQKWTGKWNKTP